MADSKKITVMRAGGSASIETDVVPGETAEQLCTLVAPDLGLPMGGAYRVLAADGYQVTGDVYNAVKDGDTLTLAQIGEGG